MPGSAGRAAILLNCAGCHEQHLRTALGNPLVPSSPAAAALETFSQLKLRKPTRIPLMDLRSRQRSHRQTASTHLSRVVRPRANPRTPN
jgi:hypothetical protein